MASKMDSNAYFPNEDLNQKLLVVGAGGIGCELLKNLAVAGFLDIEVIDLDTIDVSNLSRQFLFRREHVGMPKAQVAAESARAMRPGMNIVYHHDSIFNNKFNVEYFKQFAVVLNALDNLAARRHVNRLCVSGEVPLIDGGSTGYKGQVRVIKRYVTECFDCVEHEATQKTFPTCTIRNTPSEFIHCITWAKFLFNQLFGEPDPDEDVAPMEEENKDDPVGTNGESSDANGKEEEKAKMVSTRQFAASHNYDAQQLYDKLFVRDIDYLLKMDDLWKQRRPPQPYRVDDLFSIPQSSAELPLNIVWSLEKWITEFALSVQNLAKKFEEEAKNDRVLSWDKDDDDSLRFVAACANIRAHIFQISGKSLFDVKSMAGNIIPAIATTNAIVAGLMVVETYKVIRNQEDKLQSSFISLKPSVRGKILNNDERVKPNPNCYVCANRREIFVKLNTAKMTQKLFTNLVLKQGLGMIAPDVSDIIQGRIVVSSEESENEAIADQTLSALSIANGSQLECDDFNQCFDCKVFILHDDELAADEYTTVRDSGKQKSEDEPSPVIGTTHKHSAEENDDAPPAKLRRITE